MTSVGLTSQTTNITSINEASQKAESSNVTIIGKKRLLEEGSNTHQPYKKQKITQAINEQADRVMATYYKAKDKLFHRNGNPSYIGETYKGLPNGKGIYYAKDGITPIFKGSSLDGKKTQGRYYSHDERFFVGVYKNSVPHSGFKTIQRTGETTLVKDGHSIRRNSPAKRELFSPNNQS